MRIGTCSLTGILVVLGPLACGRPDAAPDPHQVLHAGAADSLATRYEVDTATVEVPLLLAAQVYVEHDALVLGRSRGIVESVYVELGAPVEQGQLLAELEHIDQEIARAQAREAYQQQELVVSRSRELAKSGGVTRADSEAAEFAFQNAALALRQAERAYDLTRITAPFPGAVTARMVRPHRLVADGDSLFRVTALAPLLVSVHVPEGAAAHLAPGSSARAAGVEGRSALARVVRVSPAVDPASGTREVILELPGGSGFRPGTSVSLRVGAERRRVVAVPAEALDGQGYATVWENGRSTLRPVTVGATLADGRLEVLSGLSPGESVVREPR